MNKIKSILYPGGVLVIAVPNIDSILVKLRKTRDNACLWGAGVLTKFSQRGFSNLLERTGFEFKYNQNISRFPYFMISNRLTLHGFPRQICNYIVKISQYIPLKIIDYLDMEMCPNTLAQISCN